MSYIVMFVGLSLATTEEQSRQAHVGSESDCLGLPTHTVIVTNSSKYTDISAAAATAAQRSSLSGADTLNPAAPTVTENQQSDSKQPHLIINQSNHPTALPTTAGSIPNQVCTGKMTSHVIVHDTPHTYTYRKY